VTEEEKEQDGKEDVTVVVDMKKVTGFLGSK
jgi:hypothetical protein